MHEILPKFITQIILWFLYSEFGKIGETKWWIICAGVQSISIFLKINEPMYGEKFSSIKIPSLQI